MKTFSEILKKNPDLKDEEMLKGAADDFDRLSEIRTINNSKAGKALIAFVKTGAVARFGNILSSYKTIPHQELLAELAYLDSEIGILSEILGEKTYASILQTIEEYTKNQ